MTHNNVSLILKQRQTDDRWALCKQLSHLLLMQVNRYWQEKVGKKQASHGMWGSVGLKMPIHAHFFRQAILTH